MKRYLCVMRTACLVVVLAALVVRAPAARAAENGEGWISLFNGKDLTGWKVRRESYQVEKAVDAAGHPIPGAKIVKIAGRQAVLGPDKQEIKDAKVVSETVKNLTGGWIVEDGVLISAGDPNVGKSDIFTERTFRDVQLHVEFLATGNSGVFVHGLYEIQIDNSFGMKPEVKEVKGQGIESSLPKTMCGAMYGQVAPAKNMSKPRTEWQTYDATFRAARAEGGKVKEKARITLVWNGEKVIDNAEVGPSITAPSHWPLRLQGDHGRVSFRNIKIKPLTADK